MNVGREIDTRRIGAWVATEDTVHISNSRKHVKRSCTRVHHEDIIQYYRSSKQQSTAYPSFNLYKK